MTPAQSVLAIKRKRTQLLALLKNEATRQGVPPENIQHQFAFQLFLTRLFANGNSRWVLKGGTSLLMRIGSGRRSRDIDLARDEQLSPNEALEELWQLVAIPGKTDPDLTFELHAPARDNQDPEDRTRGSFKVDLMLGTQKLVHFSVDLSTQHAVYAAVDQVPLKPVISYSGLPGGTVVQTVPVENTTVDKLCACYEKHGNRDSTRYHDLIDLVRIVTTLELRASVMRRVVVAEAASRKLELPSSVVAPGPEWQKAYPSQARSAADFPKEFHSLDRSLEVVGQCLNPLLRNELTEEKWNPERQAWEA